MSLKWEFFKLKDLITLKTGKLDSNQEEINGTYPFFTCAPNPSRINSFAFNQKAILLAGNNANGNFHINYYEGKFNAYQRTYVINVLDAEKLNLKYLFYSLKICLNDLKRMSQGTSTRFLTKNILNNFEIGVPPMEIQKKIVDILDNLSDKIKVNKKINSNLEEQIHLLYDKYFTNYFYNDKKEDLIKSEIGFIPRNWKIIKLSDLIIKNKEKIKNYDEWKNELLIDLSNMPRFSISLYNYDKGEKLKSNIYKLDKFDLLFGSIRPYFGKVGFSPINGVVAGTILSFKPVNKIYYSYILSLISSKEFIKYTVSVSKGTKMPSVKWKDFINYDIAIPKNEEVIEKYNNILKPIILKIEKNIEEVHNLTKIRDILIPKLMSGEIDVSKINCDLNIVIYEKLKLSLIMIKNFILNFLKYHWRLQYEN